MSDYPRPGYNDLGNRNIRRADASLQNSQLGGWVSGGVGFFQVIASLVNEFFGVKKPDGGSYGRDDVHHWWKAFFKTDYPGSKKPEDSGTKFSWDTTKEENARDYPSGDVKVTISKAEIKDNSIVYECWINGRMCTIEKSMEPSPLWAANNPGGIKAGSEIATKFKAIEKPQGADAAKFDTAVFPDAVTGVTALVVHLRDKYDGMTVADVLRDYSLAAGGSIDATRDIDTLTPEEIGTFARDIANKKGWAPGDVKFSSRNMPDADRDIALAAVGVTPELQKSHLVTSFSTAVSASPARQIAMMPPEDPNAAVLVPGKPLVPLTSP